MAAFFFALLILICRFSFLYAAEEVKIASTGPGLSTLPLEIATRKRFFQDEGIDALIITMRANIAVSALLSKNVEYATPSTSTIKAATADCRSKRSRCSWAGPITF
jgi:ABC-type nitrate/sulfonate/bicarbonate transport system substrate-binding protein